MATMDESEEGGQPPTTLDPSTAATKVQERVRHVSPASCYAVHCHSRHSSGGAGDGTQREALIVAQAKKPKAEEEVAAEARERQE